MGRRRRQDETVMLVAQLGALAVLGAMVSPQVRQALSIGTVMVVGAVSKLRRKAACLIQIF